MELAKIPPHDIQAEQAVIGSMLLDKDAVINAIEVLKQDKIKPDNIKKLSKELNKVKMPKEPKLPEPPKLREIPEVEPFIPKISLALALI